MRKFFHYSVATLLATLIAACNTLNNEVSSTGKTQSVTPLPSKAPKQIALLLPLSGSLSPQGQAILSGFTAANANNGNQATIKTYDVNSGSIDAQYQTALQQGADFVVGPLSKPNVERLTQNNITVPTLTLNYVNPNENVPDLLYQFGLSPQDEAKQAADRAIHDGHKQALVIVPATSWGRGIADAFAARFSQQGGSVTEVLAYQADTQTLTKQVASALQFKESKPGSSTNEGTYRPNRKTVLERRQDIDMVFMTAQPSIARQIRPLLKFYNAGDLPVYATSQVYSGTPNPTQDRDLDGVMFCDIPWVFNNPPVLANTRSQLAGNPNFQRYLGLYALGADASQLTSELSELTNSSTSGVTGATGTLYLRGHQVMRQLQWAQFRDGAPVLLPNYPAPL